MKIWRRRAYQALTAPSSALKPLRKVCIIPFIAWGEMCRNLSAERPVGVTHESSLPKILQGARFSSCVENRDSDQKPSGESSVPRLDSPIIFLALGVVSVQFPSIVFEHPYDPALFLRPYPRVL
jgi:hypothetical protein